MNNKPYLPAGRAYWLFQGVASAFIPRVTAENSFQPQPRSGKYTIAIDRLVGILTACGREAARTISQIQCFQHAGIRRQVALVKTYGRKN